MKKYIAVIGGTPVDVAFGEDLLQDAGYTTLPLPVSNTPYEQTYFELLPQIEREHIIIDMLLSLTEDIACVVMYCDSLSSSLRLDYIKEHIPYELITTLHAYERSFDSTNVVGIISANAQSAAHIERIIFENNENIVTLCMSSLVLVEAIETLEYPKEIVKRSRLQEIINFFEEQGANYIILGSTHFDYLFPYLSVCTAQFIQPKDSILRDIQKIYSNF